MKNYRIKEHQGFNRDYYEVQRKSILGFWYNYENVDGYTTGFYNSIEEARESIARKQHKTKTRIVN